MLDLLTAEAVDAIHRQSMRILSEIGITFNSPEAMEYFRKAGALVSEDTGRVRMDAELVNEALRTVSKVTVLTPRNAQRRVTIPFLRDYLATRD